jgi:hypothetical protein
LESLVYILVYAMKGKLPWQGLLYYDDDTRIKKIAGIKQSLTAEKLTENTSPFLTTFFKYVKRLKFTDDPDYDYLIKLLKDASMERGVDISVHQFEWIRTKPGARSNSNQKSITGNELSLQKSNSGDLQEIGEPKLPQNKKPTSKEAFDEFACPSGANFLEIPNGQLKAMPQFNVHSKKELDSSNPGKGGFHSNVVLGESVNNIPSWEESKIMQGIGEFINSSYHNSQNGQIRTISPENEKNKSQQYLGLNSSNPSGMKSSLTPSQRKLVENYDEDAMEENTNSVAQKIMKSSNSRSKLIYDLKDKFPQKKPF